MAALLPLLSSFAVAQESNVAVLDAWARETPGGAKTGAAFLQVTAKTDSDKLIDARSSVAEHVELHNHVHENGVMRMRRVDAIEVPAGKTVTLEPGGYHLMLMNLKQPLKAGDTIDLTLVFEKAGQVEVTASVQPIGAKGPGGAESGHGHSQQSDGDHGHQGRGHKQ